MKRRRTDSIFKVAQASCQCHSPMRSNTGRMSVLREHPTQPAPLTTRGAAASAFTLLEVILAVTIAGALLAGAATIMVSVSNAWLERQDQHFYEDHVDGVTEFLQACLIAAGSEIALGESNNAAPSGGGLMRVSEDPISWSKPPGYANYQDPLLHFSLRDTPPLLISKENAPVVGVEVFLHFEGREGLSLLWYTPLQEDPEDVDDLRRTPISDLITKIEYIYWDDSFEKWETETEPKEGEGEEQFILPRFLRLTFEYLGETKERTLTIPVPSRSVLLF
jgi:hypothetical protein